MATYLLPLKVATRLEKNEIQVKMKCATMFLKDIAVGKIPISLVGKIVYISAEMNKKSNETFIGLWHNSSMLK